MRGWGRVQGDTGRVTGDGVEGDRPVVKVSWEEAKGVRGVVIEGDG